MSIKNGGVQGSGGGNKPESAEELKQKQAAEQGRAAQQSAASDQAELTNGLNGQDRQASGTDNSGRGNTGSGQTSNSEQPSGSGQASGNTGLAGALGVGGTGTVGGAYGYAGIFGNQSLDVDAEQLNDLSNRFFNYTMACGAMPFGIGAGAMQNSIGNWFQAFMNCFRTSSSASVVAGGGSVQQEVGTTSATTQSVGTGSTGATGSAGSGSSSVDSGANANAGAGTGSVPEGYHATNTAGVYSKNGKYYHYVDGALQECNADGTAISHQVDDGAVKGKDKAHHRTGSTPTAKPQAKPKQKTESELAKDQGFTKQADGTYRKGGKTYKFANGSFQYAYDVKYKNGQYVKNGTIYNADGTKSDRTIKGYAAQDSIYTLEHYKNEGYTMTSYKGQTVLTSKDKKTTLYFDNTGKLVQQNFHNTGFMRDGRTEVSRFAYNKMGQLQSKEEYNNQTRTTVRTEYVSPKGVKAGTTKTVGQPRVVEEMDAKGQISRSKEQEITTVKTEIKGGIAVRTTTIQRQVVK